MKNLKKDNKGFSLVELIVVVLIMAIIAVALAPQVLKWVNNSRISSDQNTMQAIVTAAQNALSNETVYGDIKVAGAGNEAVELKVPYGGTGSITAKNSVSVTNFTTKFNEYAGATIGDFKCKTKGNTIIVTVYGNGKTVGNMTVNVDSIDD